MYNDSIKCENKIITKNDLQELEKENQSTDKEGEVEHE